jgi:hypothetical protein
MKRLNKLLKQAGVLIPVTRGAAILALLRESPLTKDDDVSTVITIDIESEGEVVKIRNAVARAIKALPQWEFGTKLDKANLTLYVGKYEKEVADIPLCPKPNLDSLTIRTTEVQPNL